MLRERISEYQSQIQLHKDECRKLDSSLRKSEEDSEATKCKINYYFWYQFKKMLILFFDFLLLKLKISICGRTSNY